LIGFGVFGLRFLKALLIRAGKFEPQFLQSNLSRLGSSAIIYIMRDSRGFLWFCTRDGLSRFDEVRFTTYSIG
jgi:ligand-binding sensor domain-containing protein